MISRYLALSHVPTLCPQVIKTIGLLVEFPPLYCLGRKFIADIHLGNHGSNFVSIFMGTLTNGRMPEKLCFICTVIFLLIFMGIMMFNP
jgi:hypothetical protein